MNKKSPVISKIIVKYGFILLGTILTAVALEIFLKSHQLIGGGIIGIAVMKSYVMKVPLSVTALILNFPFLFFIYKRKGKSFILPSVFSILSLSCWISLLDPLVLENQEILHAAAFGGILLGIGSGFVLHYGGFLDGIYFQPKLLKQRLSLAFILINLCILLVSGLVFGWDKSIYSLMACLIALKVGDITSDLFVKKRKVTIVTDQGDRLADTIMERLGRDVTLTDEADKTGKGYKKILYADASPHEIAVLESIVQDIDRHASVRVSRNC